MSGNTNLHHLSIYHDQLKFMFEKLSEDGSQLRHLILRDVNLSVLNQEVFSSGAIKLQSLDLQVIQVENSLQYQYC